MQLRTMSIHPRPQLTRSQWLDLSGSWGFAYDDTRCGLDEHWQGREDIYTQTIQVPFPPESAASGIGDTSYHPVVWYRRAFELPASYAAQRILLHFGAVDYRAQVWVNGQHVASHEGGHTPFSADITSALQSTSEQVVVVRAEDMPLDMTQPRGKQDWQGQTHSIWYKRTTGIWQPVWIEPVSAVHITRIRWTPDLDQGLLGLAVSLQHVDGSPLGVRVRLSLRGKILLDDTYNAHGQELYRQIAYNQSGLYSHEELFWSPEHPNLIDATLTVLKDGQVIDEVQSYIGLRSVGMGNGRFMLNGYPYYLRLVLEQGYWPQSLLAAPSEDALRQEVELVKDLGFNGMRLHQKVEDPRLLYWCDRLGLLVWGEMANAYIFSPQAVERLTREWLDVLARDYNHPCIVAWVPFNESWGVPNLLRDSAQRHYVQTLYHLTKTLDPTRLTIGNDGWEHVVSDIYGVHDYAFHGSVLTDRYGSQEAVERTLRKVQPGGRKILLPDAQRSDEPVMITEFGGISYRPKDNEPWFGYGTVETRSAYFEKYAELIKAILDSPAIAGFCYTQLTDTEQETNGLLTAERKPKFDPLAIRAVNRGMPAAVRADIAEQVEQQTPEAAPASSDELTTFAD